MTWTTPRAIGYDMPAGKAGPRVRAGDGIRGVKDEDLHIGRAHTARGRLGCVARGIIPGRLTPASATPPRLFIVAVGLAAVAYLLVLTPVLNRPDLPDPAAYVGAARNIASGRGITLPFVPISTDIRPSAAAELNG